MNILFVKAKVHRLFSTRLCLRLNLCNSEKILLKLINCNKNVYSEWLEKVTLIFLQ